MAAHYPIAILTERLKLRPFREDDWEAVHEYATDPEISKFQEWGPNSVKDTKLFVRRCMESTNDPMKDIYFFSIVLLGADLHIGGCVLSVKPEGSGDAIIGYTIGRRHWDRGFATEAACALLTFAFGDLALRRVFAYCDKSNTASWRVMEKVGMRRVFTDQNARYFKGQWRDSLEYAITDSEWRQYVGVQHFVSNLNNFGDNT